MCKNDCRCYETKDLIEIIMRCYENHCKKFGCCGFENKECEKMKCNYYNDFNTIINTNINH
jgi:hypothetical protein